MFSTVAPRLLVLLCLSACAPKVQAPTPPSPPATPATGGACASSAPAPVVTSKLRHIPDENDPCANSRGLSPR
ncbi:hypothetical protein GJ697_23375 [Pseudoduganella sp. FT25W]|uniref:Peptidase n=1 Tax=Duganella alba TaxID=2666081 RepID=A0A6L5QMA2_9BURK|nr:hypothetical protein [Duganella alba]MRX10775.1 hypothetical protein [Duganella alba]MRX18894.1 hypothetical protein [Duganella alba]